MFKDWSKVKSDFRAGKARMVESESYSANAVYKQGMGVRCGGGIEKGSPNWSRPTVFHPCAPRKRASQSDKAPDVAIVRTFEPIRSLSSLVERTSAPLAKESQTVAIGALLGKANRKGQWVGQFRQSDGTLGGGRFIPQGERQEGETSLAISTQVERKFARYVAKAKPSQGERQEVEFRKRAKAKESRERLAAKGKAISGARKTQDKAKEEAAKRSARMDWRRNLSRLIRLNVVSDLV